MNKLVLSVSRLRRITRKAALLPLLLPLLLYVGAQFYLQRIALYVVENAIATLPDSVQFKFEEIDTHFGGVVDIQGATLLLPGMSLPMQFQTLQLMTNHWRELPAIVGALDQGRLPDEVRIEFALAETELSRLASASQIPVDAARLTLGCFKHASGAAAPGLEEAAVFAGSFDYRFDPQSEYLSARLQWRSEQRYEADISADFNIGAAQLLRTSVDAIGLGGAEVSYVNLGAQTALMRDCGAEGDTGLVEGSYAARQGGLLKHWLEQQGWMVSTELEFAYLDYLFLPKQLNLQLTAAEAVSWAELEHLPASWRQFAVRVGLNAPQADRLVLSRQPTQATTAEKVAAKRTPAERAALKKVPKRVAVELAALEDMPERVIDAARSMASVARSLAEKALAEPEPRARSPIREKTLQQLHNESQPSYKPVLVAQLSGLLGTPMRLTTHNGRRVEGVLESVTSQRLRLRREISKGRGVVVLPIRLAIISGMQAYF
ncbi:MAG: hypothetical protein V7629_14490 [Motiliproteus sp.]